MIKELFSQILQQCEGFDGSTGAPVLNVQLRGGGAAAGGGTGTTFAFVEFRDETLSATIATFNGMELYGRNLKISHPNGYVRAHALRARIRIRGQCVRSRLSCACLRWSAFARRQVAPDVPVKTLGIPEDIMKRFGLGSYEAMRRQDKPPQELADRKVRAHPTTARPTSLTRHCRTRRAPHVLRTHRTRVPHALSTAHTLGWVVCG
jgi:hypothetical protein